MNAIYSPTSETEIETESEARFELWEHGQSGEVFAIRLDAGRNITGCQGPLLSNQIYRRKLGDFRYDENPVDLAWIEKHRENWAPVEFQNPPHY